MMIFTIKNLAVFLSVCGVGLLLANCKPSTQPAEFDWNLDGESLRISTKEASLLVVTEVEASDHPARPFLEYPERVELDRRAVSRLVIYELRPVAYFDGAQFNPCIPPTSGGSQPECVVPPPPPPPFSQDRQSGRAVWDLLSP